MNKLFDLSTSHFPPPYRGSRESPPPRAPGRAQQVVSCELVCMNHSVPALYSYSTHWPFGLFWVKTPVCGSCPNSWEFGSVVDRLLNMYNTKCSIFNTTKAKRTSNSAGRRISPACSASVGTGMGFLPGSWER